MNILNNTVRTVLHTVETMLLACCALCFSGCVEQFEEEIVGDVSITLRLDEAFQEKAYVRLNHDGSQDDCWFYIVTEDMETAAEVLLKEHVADSLAGGGRIVGNTGTNKSILVENLEPKTEYRVLATIILPDGRVAGTPADFTFVTLRNPDTFYVHPSWKMEYAGRKVSEKDPDEETELFTCSVGESRDPYVPCLLLKKDFESTYGGNLRTCFEDYVAFRNKANVKWPNVVKDSAFVHVEERLMHGDYILFMVGMTSEGELTGDYARTDCTIRQETPSDAYMKWIGKWTLKGSNEEYDFNFPVEITAEENNLYCRMSGYESNTAVTNLAYVTQDRPLLLYFEKSSGALYVVSEDFDDFDDAATAELYDFHLYGCIELEYYGTMTSVPVNYPDIKVAKFTLVSDSRATASPMMFTDMGYNTPFLYFNYSYTFVTYDGLVPLTTDALVPRIETITLVK